MIPNVVFVLMVLSATTKSFVWEPGYFQEDKGQYSEVLFLSMNECRAHAPPKGTEDAHGIPVKWTCVPYYRGSR